LFWDYQQAAYAASQRGAKTTVSDKNSSDAASASHASAAATPAKDKKIRVAIVGVGNCASSLVQGRYYYENASETDFIPGLMHVNLGGYHIRDIEFVPPSTSTRTRSARTCPRPSTPSRTTPSSSTRSRTSASRSIGA